MYTVNYRTLIPLPRYHYQSIWQSAYPSLIPQTIISNAWQNQTSTFLQMQPFQGINQDNHPNPPLPSENNQSISIPVVNQSRKLHRKMKTVKTNHNSFGH